MRKENRMMTRRHIFNIVYQYPFYGENTASTGIEDYMALLEYERQYETEHDGNFEILEINEEFICSEVLGIISNISQIDEVIEKYTVGWTIERLASVDLAILRIAVYEILFVETIPSVVSANEAVDIAKDYSSEKSPSFINGVLSSVIKNEKERV